MSNNFSVCKSLNALTIIKLIVKNINPNELENKFIFVGARDNNIVNILNKLEKNNNANYTLDKEDHLQLEKIIPFYNKKFGNLTNYNIYFIYHYLDEHFNINHACIIIYEAIKQKNSLRLGNDIYHFQPHNLLLYKYSRNINYKHYINLLNYIFELNKELTNDDFFNRIYKVTYLTKKQVYNKLNELLPKKILHHKNKEQIIKRKQKEDKPLEPPPLQLDKTILLPSDKIETPPKDIDIDGERNADTDINTYENSSFINKVLYYYEDCLNLEELYHLLMSTPTLLTINNNYIIDSNKYIYYGYQNIDYLIDILRSSS